MGDVIRFPLERRQGILPPHEPVEPGWRANVTVSGPINLIDCTELVHNFDAVPGRCRCGERYWDPDHPEESA